MVGTPLSCLGNSTEKCPSLTLTPFGVDIKASTTTAGRGPPPGISFDRFVRACVVVKQLSESFGRLDTDRDGWIQINYDQFMETVLSLPWINCWWMMIMMKEGFIVLFFVCNPKTLFFLFSFFFYLLWFKVCIFFFPHRLFPPFILKIWNPLVCMYDSYTIAFRSALNLLRTSGRMDELRLIVRKIIMHFM